MRVKATKDFSSTVHGNVSTGEILNCTDGLGRHFIEHGLAKPVEYDTKVVREVPTVPGEGKPSSSSPAARASRKKTPKRSAGKARS